MYCSISGVVPSEPVVSAKTGILYERRLIEKLLSANGNKCPETGEALSKEQLLPVVSRGTVSPIPPEKSTVPDVLRFVNEEWDRVNIELHQAKADLYKARKELATSLYRYDAAMNVIADLESSRAGTTKQPSDDHSKLPNENDDSQKLNTPQPTPEEEHTLLPPEVLNMARKKAEQLQTERKARKFSGSHTSEGIAAFREFGQIAVDGSDAVVESIAVLQNNAYAGCSSGKLHSMDTKGLTVLRSVTAHVGGVTSVSAGPSGILSGGKDKFVRVWDTELKEKQSFESSSGVVQVERHPIGMIFSCYEDGCEFRDSETGASIANGKADSKLLCGAIHPDGMVFATGGSGIKIWDVSNMQEVAQLGTDQVVDIAMSEKGYYLICCGNDKIDVWDLRKQLIVGTVGLNGAAGVCVDDAGEYGCGVGEGGVALFTAKKKAKQLCCVDGQAHTWKGRRGSAWSDSFVLAGGGDGVVRTYASSDDSKKK